MDLLQTVRKEGSRGGRAEFKWEDVKNDAQRENYLGHSLMAPVGRWQQNRDLNWYAKGDTESKEAEAARIKEEKRKLKEAEEDAMLAAMGLPVPERNNANLTPLGEKALEADVKEAIEEKAKGGEDEDRAKRRDRKERSRRHRDGDDRDRHIETAPGLARGGGTVTEIVIGGDTVLAVTSTGDETIVLSREEGTRQMTSLQDLVLVRENVAANVIRGPEGENDTSPPRPKPVIDSNYEKDSDIYKKLVAACYQFHGKWKKWIPFYGVVGMQETQFCFNAMTDIQDKFEIHLKPLDLEAHDRLHLSDNLRSLLRKTERNEPKDRHFMSFSMRTSLERYYLLKACALDPMKADRLYFPTLEGMALKKSPILNDNDFKLPTGKTNGSIPTDTLPGFEMALGWQTGRIIHELPANMTT
ncbi:hypothetical protein E8E13_007063 [Curvularia kusanoi]|uniref:Multiple myeloma tumor-associated protein 2-like N-terminal domain-containing protein n=1 Tax=Curvularia kusanoi TaxID=90978 RepID=A0A9P4TFK8_CURKU|nr:hypothetical protein E8E13_007063 [Curvularia kusanoi]